MGPLPRKILYTISKGFMDTLEFTPVPYWGNLEDVNSDQTWAMWKSKLILCWAVFYNLRAGPVEVLEGQVMPKPVSHVLLQSSNSWNETIFEISETGSDPPQWTLPSSWAGGPEWWHLSLRIHRTRERPWQGAPVITLAPRTPGSFPLGKLSICDFLLVGGCMHIFKVVDMVED